METILTLASDGGQEDIGSPKGLSYMVLRVMLDSHSLPRPIK